MEREGKMKKVFSEIILMLLLTNMLASAFIIQPAKAEPRTWIVDDDGPADFHTIQEAINVANPGDTIIVNDGIYIENIVVYKSLNIRGSGSTNTILSPPSIRLGYALTIRADYVSLTGFRIIIPSETYGMRIEFANHVKIAENTITGEGWVGIWFYETSYSEFSSNNVIRNDWHALLLTHSNNNSIVNNNVTNNGMKGVGYVGIYIEYSSNNTLFSNNIMENTGYGVVITYATARYNKVFENNIIRNRYGLWMLDSAYNFVSGNNVTENTEYGISLHHSSQNIVSENYITNNGVGILPYYSSENNIFHNNFINNVAQVISYDSMNVWDDGYPSGGNYWSDYTGADYYSGPYQDKPGSDGIGDTPYVIDDNNVDRYPLMRPWTPIPLERIYGIPVDFRFQEDLYKGIDRPEVRYLQIILNTDPDTRVATSGPGSPGDETTYFGSLTEDAVKRFQRKYAIEPTGYVGPITRKKLNEILEEKFTVVYKEKFGLLNKEERKSAIWKYIKEFKSSYLPEVFPNELILAVATQETGEYAHWNNEHVANDWGRGIMQITTNSYVGAGGVDSDSEECIKARNRESKIYSSMYYSNTPKGIEANIKDGLYALGDKYRQVKKDKIQPPEGYAKDEIIWMSTVQRYNGFRAKPSEYIWYIGLRLIELADGKYGNFEGFNSEYARTLGKKFQQAYNEKITLYSPAQLRVYDSEGNVAGLVNGEIREDITNSIYDNETRTILIFFPQDYYYYTVMGSEEATYGLNATLFKEGESVSFTATNIPIVSGAIHQYTVDWAALSFGKEGVTVMVDSDGDGVFEHTFTSDSELTHDEFVLQTETVIDVDPDALNLNSKGHWITAYIEFPEGYNVADINVSSITLNGTIPVDPSAMWEMGDYDGDGVPDLMVKFNRTQIIDYILVNVNMAQLMEQRFMTVTLTIKGKLNDGTPFQASCTIKVIWNPPKR